MLSKAAIERDHFVGRDDLKIPFIEFGVRSQSFEVLKFFRKFWELNDFDTSREERIGGEAKPKGYSHELVLPATANQPLTVIRGSYKPRDGKELADEIARNKDRRHSHNGISIRTGKEKHRVLVPPTRAGSFATVLCVSYLHTTRLGVTAGLCDWAPRVTAADGEQVFDTTFDSHEMQREGLSQADVLRQSLHKWGEAVGHMTELLISAS